MKMNKMIGGAIVLLLGVAFLLANFGILSYDFWKFWPLILIIVGGGMLFGGDGEKKKK